MEQRLVYLFDESGSYSRDALKTTSYLDDYIVRGNIFTISLAPELTAATPAYFTSEFSDPSVTAVFLLPIHLSPTSGYSIMNIYEETDYTGGTLLSSINRNRNSSTTAEVIVKTGATGSDKGDLLYTHVFGVEASAPAAGSEGGGSGASANAFVLNLSKKYLYEITNTETATVGIIAEFGEI